jgi:four helix bundle protein
MNNISEGFCRNSDAEFHQFLNIAKGSAGEVKNMYYIAEDQVYADAEISLDRRNKSQKLINSISSFMKYLKGFRKSRT